MYEFHTDRLGYFNMQTANAEKYVIPFIEEKLTITEGMNILEVGCAEGGVLKAFLKKGCTGVGVELDLPRLEFANEFNKEYIEKGQVKFIGKNIYDSSFETEFAFQFDLIILKDVIEHIHDQEKIIPHFKKFLKHGGHIFFGFPPYAMPFGGHQQIGKTKLFSILPYTHLLPMPLYRMVLKIFGESEFFEEIKETAISTDRFERICKNAEYSFVNSRFYFINPIYEFKFGLKPIVQLDFIRNIPYFRDLVTTCVYYLIKK